MIFAVGVAIGFAKKSDGSTALAAVVGYLVFSNVLKAFGPTVNVDPACTGDACATQHDAPDPKVFGGIVIGITAALLWQRYYRLKLVPWLAFFGGRRFVPIITAVAAILWGVFFGIVWPRPPGTQAPSPGRSGLHDHPARLRCRQPARPARLRSGGCAATRLQQADPGAAAAPA